MVTKKPAKKNIRVPIKTVKCSPASFRYKTLSADKGIKGLFCCPARKFRKGKCSEGVKLVTAVYDGDKWTKAKATAHAKKTFKNPNSKPKARKKSGPDAVKFVKRYKQAKDRGLTWEQNQKVVEIKKKLVEHLLDDDLFAASEVANYIEEGHSATEALKRYVDSVEGDVSQLPRKLADYAKDKGWI